MIPIKGLLPLYIYIIKLKPAWARLPERLAQAQAQPHFTSG